MLEDQEEHLRRKGKYYRQSMCKETPCIQQNEGRLTVLVISCVGTAVLKHVIEGKVEGNIDVTGRRWHKKLRTNLKKREETENYKRKQHIGLCRELALEEALALS